MPAKAAVRKTEILVIPGLGLSPRARNPGTQTSASLGMAGVHRFRAWSYGPSRNDEEVSVHQGHFVTAAFAGATGKGAWGSFVSFAPVASRHRGRGSLIFQPRREVLLQICCRCSHR